MQKTVQRFCNLFVKAISLTSVLIVLSTASMAVFSYTRAGTQSRVVYAATNASLNFQGRLLSNTGSVVPDGNYHLEFKLYDGGTQGGSAGTGPANEGTLLWTETRSSGNLVRLVNGYFSVDLGSATPFPNTINWDQELWLTMNVGGNGGSASWDGEMLAPANKRTRLTGVPYAFQAERSASLNRFDGTFTGTLDFLSLTANRTITLPDKDGTLCIEGSEDCVDVETSGTTVLTGSNSGLEISANGLRLLGGCSDAQMLRWDATAVEWQCASVSGSAITVASSDGSVTTSASAIEFGPDVNSEDEFIVTDEGSGLTRIRLGNTVLTTANYASTLDSQYVNTNESPSSGDITGTFASGFTINANSVALGADTTGDYVQALGTLNGLSVTGNSGEGSTPGLSVLYGTGVNTSVQGNTQLTCASGTGNLSGGGTVVTLGGGGTCGAITTNSAVSFGSSVTTPLLTSGGALTVSSTGANDLTLTSGSGLLNLNASAINLTTGLAFDLVSASNLTYSINNSGAGVANLNLVDGSFQTGGTVRLTNAGALQNVSGDNSNGVSFNTNVLTAGTLDTGRGGTGLSSFTANGLLYASSTSALAQANGTSGQVLIANGSNVPTFTTLTGDVTINSSGVITVGADTVALGADTTGNYVASLGSMVGLSITGSNSGEGVTPGLSVLYGSTANTAVQGSTQLTCASGTGNLGGGGTVITLGTGGTCGAITTNNAVSFSTSVTTPLVTNAGALTVSATGANNLTLSSGSGLINVGATSLATTNSLAIDLANAATTILTLENSGAGVANLELADGNLVVGGQTVLTSARVLQNLTGLSVSSGGATIVGNMSVDGTIFDPTGNLVLNDTVDVGSETTGLRIATDGSLLDIDGNIVLNDQTDIGSSVAGLRITTGGSLSDIDGDLVLNDQLNLGSSTTGLQITTDGVITDIDDASIVFGEGITVMGDSTVTGTFITYGTGYNAFSSDANLSSYGFFRSVITSDSVSRFEIGAYDLNGASQGARYLTLNPLGGYVGVGGDLTPDGLFSVGTTSQFQVSALGAVTAVGVDAGTGAITGAGGLSITSGGATISGGALAFSGGGNFSVDSAAFDVTATGAVSGVTTFNLSGAISGATATNTINGLIINSGTLSGITGMTFTSGGLNLNSGGITNAGAIAGATGLTSSGTITFSGLSTAGVVKNNASGVLSTGTVILGSETTGNYVASIGTLSGLSVSGNTGAGSTPGLSVLYGSTANTAVQGSTQLTCASGTGNLGGGGTVITLGTGGTCGAITTNNAVSFSTSVTTPLVTNAGALTISTTGGTNDLTISSGSGLINLNGSTIVGNGATQNLFNTVATTINFGGAATTLNIGPGGATATNINLAGGSGATGCTVDGATGNLTCSGAITTTASSGNLGWWSRSGTTVSPTNNTDNINTTGGAIQTAGTTRLTNSGALNNVTGDNINGVSFNANTITAGNLVTARGGTGLSSFTANGLLYASSTSALAQANGTSGQVLIANGSNVPTFTTLTGDVTINSSGVITVGADTVALGADTTGNYVASLGSMVGLSITGSNSGEGVTPGLSVLYGSTANTAVQGSTQLTCASGTGNLGGGGTVITLGTGGTCSAITISNAPSFTTSITTPLLQNAGLTLASTGVNSLFFQTNGLTRLTISDTGVSTFANNITVSSGGVTVTGNSSINGTLTGLTGLTFTSGNLALGGGNISDVGTLGLSGAITGATATNTINGLIINSGALSGITGITFTSGGLNLNSGGITNAGAIAGATTISASGLVTSVGLTSGSGLIQGTGGLTITGATNINTSGSTVVNIGNASTPLTITSTGFKVTSGGAITGVSTLGLSGAITGATATNTINGLIINSGALSGITGITFTSGALNLNSGGITNTGSIAGATTLNLSGAITGATATNTINGLIINSGALSGITGYSQSSGNFAISGTGTFSTGTGVLTLNGATSISGSNNFSVGTGTAIFGGRINANAGITVATGQSLTVNGDALTDLVGNGLQNTAGVLTIDATTAGTVAGTGSNSGLVVSADGLSLLRGCANNQILKWSTTGPQWNCAADNTGVSDSRVKKNVVTINDNILDTLKNIRVVEFDYICESPAFDTQHCDIDHQFGVIAQELQALFPELVFEDANGYLNVRYDMLGIYNLKAVTRLATLLSYNGDAWLNNVSTGNTLRLTSTGQLQNITGLSITSGGASIVGGINNNNGGLTNTGSIAGASTINASGLITTTGGLVTSGATSNINVSSNFATNINTGTSTGAINIGNGTASNTVNIGNGLTAFSLNSTGVDISSAGVISGITGLSANGNTGSTIATCTAGQYIGNGVRVDNGIITAGTCRNDASGISDERVKKDVASVGSILDRIADINVVSFNFKVSEMPQLNLDHGLQYGVIAQQLEQLFPELVSQREDGYKEVNFQGLSFYNLKAVSEIAQYINADGSARLHKLNVSGNVNVAGVLEVGTLRVDNIEGLDYLGRIDDLENQINSNEARLTAVENNQNLNLDLNNITLGKLTATADTSLQKLTVNLDLIAKGAMVVNGNATFKEAVRFEKDVLFEGQINVLGYANVQGLTVNLDLIVKGSMVVEGNATFKEAVRFEKDALFEGDVAVKGQTTFNNDTAGLVTVKAGSTTTQVTFDKEKSRPPIIALTLGNGKFAQYSYRNVTSQGFEVVLATPALEDLTFSWVAIQTEEVAGVTAP